MDEKRIIEKNGEEWKTEIPSTILAVLTQRRRLPKYPFLHWSLIVYRKTPTFRVSLGNSRGACLSELHGNETILPECVKNIAKGNVIFWSIGTHMGMPFAIAKIPEHYGKTITSRVLPKGIEIPEIVKEYMNLKARTHLAWKRTENGWLVTKNLETYDFETFHASDTLNAPNELQNVSQVKITLTDYNNKPALLIEPVPTRDPFEAFITSLNVSRIPIVSLYILYKKVENVDFKTFLELLKKHGLETRFEKDALQYRKKVVIIPQAQTSTAVTSP
jgi:hypothetical protein